MSNGIYVGVDDKARKMTGGYVGVGEKARKILKIYEGVDNVARLAWQGRKPKVWLTFSSPAAASLKTANESKNWDGELLYSTDTENWETWNGEEIQFKSQASGKYEVYLAGYENTYLTNQTVFDSSKGYLIMSGSSIKCSGNIETLLDCDEVFSGKHPVMAKYCYSTMFYKCASLIVAPELPATTLTNYCYQFMFYGCTSLTTAPELPATTLTPDCYYSMFYGCTSLTTAPELPATTLKSQCYGSMFYGCTSLTTAPKLPATTLEYDCYASMFNGCTSLTTAPELPATALASACYASMFSGCTSLTTAPELPATTLADTCYFRMFYDCTSLNLSTTPKSYSWTAPASTYTGSMFSSCKLDSSTFPNSGTPTEGTTYYWDIPCLVNKGDIIKMDLDGSGEKEFRVLKAWGNKAEVMTMWNVSTSVAFDSNETNTYAGNTLDTYLNTTWYNTLTSTAKAAIVPKNINQYQYSYSSSVYNESTHASYADYSTKSLKANVGNRYVYALDVEDIEMYFGGTGGSVNDNTPATFSKTDLLQMFWNQTSTISESLWLRSASALNSNLAWFVRGSNGYVNHSRADRTYAVRGALQIDLSKVSYTVS